MQLGSRQTATGVRFELYSPQTQRAEARLFDDDGVSPLQTRPLARGEEAGWFVGEIEGIGAGAHYKFVLDGTELPDPYARCLPFGVHGPARVVTSQFAWAHGAQARPLSEMILYEIHIGTFTPEGTYRAAIERLPSLVDLGVTAVELMPLSSFAGKRGWGYDGVAHFAPYAPYGAPDDLRAFVDAAHGLGLSTILDVVYNHFGPAGSYLGAYDPAYFTPQHETPWGNALDYSNPRMREYALENARYWFDEFRFDGLRLDATHSIIDSSPVPILKELAALARSYEPPRLLFAEDDRNDPRIVTEDQLDGIWADDFHHQVRVLFTRESEGYFVGYKPRLADLARIIENGWLYEGQSLPNGSPRGRPCDGVAREQLVYCVQNHDQIGNRATGSRLHHDVSIDSFLAASMLLLFLPATPLLFMGQEWAASTPFLYFTDHEESLGDQITAGRRDEFKHFRGFTDPLKRAAIPNPQAESTFFASKLQWQERQHGQHARALQLYRRMLNVRRQDPVLGPGDARTRENESLSVRVEGAVLHVTRARGAERRLLLVNFGHEPASMAGIGDVILRSGVDEPLSTLAPQEAAMFYLDAAPGEPAGMDR